MDADGDATLDSETTHISDSRSDYSSQPLFERGRNVTANRSKGTGSVLERRFGAADAVDDDVAVGS